MAHMQSSFFTQSFEETRELGEEFAKNLKRGTVLALHGNLGSGKTTFVQGLAKGLGIKQKIISPTFIIAREYQILGHSSSEGSESRSLKRDSSRQARTINFYHIDLYRVKSEKDVQGLGLDEIINDKENIVAIEWPEKIKKILPKDTISIHFEYQEDDKRSIKII